MDFISVNTACLEIPTVHTIDIQDNRKLNQSAYIKKKNLQASFTYCSRYNEIARSIVCRRLCGFRKYIYGHETCEIY